MPNVMLDGARRTRLSKLGLVTLTALAVSWRSISAAGDIRTIADYAWLRETDSAGFDGAYNFPVFVVHNEMWAFHPRGHWYSRDGKTWARSSLPRSGLNSGYQKYVLLGDAVYALGTM